MGRKILAVVVALVVAIAVLIIVEMMNALVITPPNQDVMNDPAKLREFMTTLPAKAYIIVLAGYVLASFAAGFIVTKMSRRESPGITLPLLVGIILMIAGVLNFFAVLPGQPLWFVALGMIIYIPLSLLGHRFAR